MGEAKRRKKVGIKLGFNSTSTTVNSMSKFKHSLDNVLVEHPYDKNKRLNEERALQAAMIKDLGKVSHD